MSILKDYLLVFLAFSLLIAGEMLRKKFKEKFFSDLQNSKKTFLYVLRIYWTIYWPLVYIVKFSQKNFSDKQNLITGFVFFFYASFIVFFIQNLRAIYNNREKNQKNVWNIFFIAWALIFILSILIKTVFYFAGNINSTDYLPQNSEIIFFLISIIGEGIFLKENKSNPIPLEKI
jgi:hypothetical protein